MDSTLSKVNVSSLRPASIMRATMKSLFTFSHSHAEVEYSTKDEQNQLIVTYDPSA